MIVLMLLSCIFSIGIEAGLREIETGDPNKRRFECVDGNLRDGLKEAFAASYNSRGEFIKRSSAAKPVNIEVQNNAHFSNHSFAAASASAPQILPSSEAKELGPNDEKTLNPKADDWLMGGVKRNLVAAFGGALGAIGIIYCIKTRYVFYCLAQRCAEVEKWSRWKNLNMLKSLVSSKKLECILVAELERQYVMHDDMLNAFFIDIDRELQELDKFLKECLYVRDSLILRFFVPVDRYLQEIEYKKEVLSYLKKVVHEILNDFCGDTTGNGCNDFFLFDED